MLKHKPLGFQIWLAMTLLMLFVALVAALIVAWLLEDYLGCSISLLELDLAGRLSRLLLGFVIINIVFAKIMASHITKPLRYLERRVRYIANRDWSLPIELDRQDEIGRLALSIGRMQESLKRLEAEEEAFLQNVSHDLKTPVMIIRSYAQAIKDGIYLDGSLEKMVHIIEAEAARLENKIAKLLFLNSLDFELQRSGDGERVEAGELLRSIASRFLFRRRAIEVRVKPMTVYVDGLADKLEVALENIIDNGIRHAASFVAIEMSVADDVLLVSISNDGAAIEPAVLERLFQRFAKGRQGDFGLGLHIARRIIEHHRGTIQAENLPAAVRFLIRLPLAGSKPPCQGG